MLAKDPEAESQLKGDIDNFASVLSGLKRKYDIYAKEFDLLLSMAKNLKAAPSATELYSGLSVISDFIDAEFESTSELKETLSTIYTGTADRIFLRAPASEWKQHLGRYHINESVSQDSVLSQKQEIELLLPDPQSREKLYEGTAPHLEESFYARNEFLEHLETVFKNSPQSTSKPKETVDLEALLGKEGLILYKAAVAEESNSRAFREAVFLQSTQHYAGPQWQQDKKLLLWVGGPSASGKTYGAGSAVNAMAQHMPFEQTKLADVLLLALKDINPQVKDIQKLIIDLKLAKTQDDVQFWCDKIDAAIDEQIENANQKEQMHQATLSTRNDLSIAVSAGNSVVSVDGGVEREVSQMRQMVLQVAVTRGYKGIGDLHKNTRLKTKNFVKAAALEQEGLNLVIPETFAESMNPLETFSDSGRYKKNEMEKYREMDNVIQAFSTVQGEDGQEKRFQISVKNMGTSRAWFPEGSEFSDEDVRMNNRDIGCESKVYQSMFFHFGNLASRTALENFQSIEPEGYSLVITNDLIFLKVDSSGHWQECELDDTPDCKLSNRDFVKWQSLQQLDNSTPDLPKWLNNQKESGALAPALISVKPNDMIKVGTVKGDTPYINLSRRDFESWMQYNRDNSNKKIALMPWCAKMHQQDKLITPIEILFSLAEYKRLLRTQSAPPQLESKPDVQSDSPQLESDSKSQKINQTTSPHKRAGSTPLVSGFTLTYEHKNQGERRAEKTSDKTSTDSNVVPNKRVKKT
tara:strand:+ start:116890 stop:119139 length:2250 start_codon:yes stop_codon:yes gene_type:complete